MYGLYCAFLLLAASPACAASGFLCAGHPAPAPAAKPAALNRFLEPRGTLHALVLFARFGDEASAEQSAPEYARDLFDRERPGSLAHFYHAMSSGQFDLEGTVLNRRYASARPAEAYLAPTAGEEGRFGEFAREILRRADADVDFRRFDNDGPDGVPDSGDDDGWVDYIFVGMHSTPRGFLRGGATGIAGLGLDPPYLSQDLGADGQPIRIGGGRGQGSISREGTFAQTAGTMAHEFGHGLGLPDLFDVEYGDPESDSAGIGRWGLMGWGALGWQGDDGPNPFCAWSLERLGWIGRDNERLRPAAGEGEEVILADLFEGGVVYKIALPPRNLENATVVQEYLLLEHHTRAGSYYNRHLPGEGLLVWHVRPHKNLNTEEEAKAVDLVCADGLYAGAGFPLGRSAAPATGRDNLDFWAHDPGYRETHAGNLGDATDPFDGVARTRFDLDSNPSTRLAGPLPSAAVTRFSISAIERRGERLAALLSPPRWAGTIEGEVHWSGDIFVDGDITVAPQGRLVIHRGTRVRFAGADRLRSGLDPGRCEIRVQGDLVLHDLGPRTLYTVEGPMAVRARPILFEPAHPGDTWYGIALDSGEKAQIALPAGAFELRRSERGIFFPEAPPGVRGLHLEPARILDSPGPRRAGNGDGRLSPGESFELSAVSSNFSLEPRERLSATLSWTPRILYRTTDATARLLGQVSLPFFALQPGQTHRIRFPSLTLSPEAAAGERIEFFVQVKMKGEVVRDTLRLAVGGRYLEHQASLEVEGRKLGNQTILVRPGLPILVRARVEGQVVGAELVVHSLPDFEAVETLPMQQEASKGGAQLFEARLRPPAQGRYQLRLRLRDPAGRTVFSPATAFLAELLPAHPRAAMVFLDSQYERAPKADPWRREVDQALAALGLQANYVLIREVDQAGTGAYEALLEELGGEGRMVLWLGRRMGAGIQPSFRAFLERGGRLLIASEALSRSNSIGPFMAQVLHARRASNARRSPLHLPDRSTSLELSVSHVALQPMAPAVPALIDRNHKVAGLRLDTGGTRLVYLAFDLLKVQPGQRRPLLDPLLCFLHRPAPARAALQLPGGTVYEHSALLQSGRSHRIQASLEAQVGGADLILRSFSGQEVVAEIPMRLHSIQDSLRRFEADLPLPTPGQYLLLLRPRLGDGRADFYATSLQIVALPAVEDHPLLVFLNGEYTPAGKESVRAALAGEAEGAKLGATFVEVGAVAPGGALIYEPFLGPHEQGTGAVLWFGRTMDAGAQSAFERFLRRGGRLLLSSSQLHRSPSIAPFLSDLFHTQFLRTATRGPLRSLAPATPLETSIPHAVFNPLPPAEPILLDAKDRPAGLRLDAGAYRLVFWALDVRDLERSALQSLLAAHLPFLQGPVAALSRLRIKDLVAPGEIASLGPLVPRVVVSNPEGEISAPFRLVYQILQGGRLLHSAEERAAPLPPGAEREISLPAWNPPGEDELRLRVGLATAGTLDFLPDRPLHIVDSRGRFEPVGLAAKPVHANGAGFFDYDNDGDLDLYLVRLNAANRLFRNDGKAFAAAAQSAGVGDEGKGRGLALGDYDGDGDLDLYLVNQGANRFLRHEDQASFSDATLALSAEPEAGLADSASGRSAGFFDYDNDGDLDLYLVNARGRNRLFRNEAGLFRATEEAAGVADAGDGRGLAIGDYDNDGDLDLFIANLSLRSRLFRNEGGLFHDATTAQGLELPGGEAAAFFGDYDNDGDLDLFVSNQQRRNRLFRNEGGGFTLRDDLDLGARTVGTAFFDYDNDGDLDLATTALSSQATGHQLYQNRGGTFVPLGPLLGLRASSQGRALAFGDYDGDGRQDLLIADARQSQLYHNATRRVHWLQLDLQGAARNRQALGAKVEVVLRNQHQYREVLSSFGYGSQIPPQIHFGLDAAATIDTLRVIWPDGLETVQTGIAADQHLSLSRNPATAVAAAASGAASFRLLPNYPNPFNATTVIPFSLPAGAGRVRLEIYNLLGQRVRTLVDGVLEPGRYEIPWEGLDQRGRSAASGVYFYHLSAGAQQRTRRLLLLK